MRHCRQHLFLFAVGLFAVSISYAQKKSSPASVACDRLAMIWGDTLRVNIKKVRNGVVSYSLYGERMRNNTATSNLTAILYKDGRVEKFDNAVLKKNLTDGASKIRITYTDEDVQVYKLLAEVEGRYVGLTQFDYTNAYLERMAIENLKEVTYKNDQRVRILLIQKVNITRGYGEAPSAVVTARAYFR